MPVAVLLYLATHPWDEILGMQPCFSPLTCLVYPRFCFRLLCYLVLVWVHLEGEFLECSSYFSVVGLATDAQKIVKILSGRDGGDEEG